MERVLISVICHIFKAGVGVIYGSAVNIISEARGKKDTALNHAAAAMLAFPACGYFARSTFKINHLNFNEPLFLYDTFKN